MGKSAFIANQSETVPGSCLLSLSLLLAYASAFTARAIFRQVIARDSWIVCDVRHGAVC
jgi:hypothetical protein